MVRDTNCPATSPGGNGDEPASYQEAVIAAYAAALHLYPEDISPTDSRKIHQALIAHAATDEEAAKQAGISIDQVHHDRTTLDALDGLPLMIAAYAPGISGWFYFSRPAEGWPRPGHRHPQ